MTTTTFQSLNVQQAGREWMEIKRPLVRARTIHDYKQHLKPLGAFFAEMPLENIQTEHLREYQKHRIAQKVGPTVINHEIGTLGQILKEARTWHTVQPYYKPLPESREGPGVALSEQQKANLFQTANSKPRWKLAYWAALLSVNTTAGPGEVRNLRIGDVDLPTRYIHIVRGAKNRYRVRSIWLNESALLATRELWELAKRRGCTSPEHFLFPHRAPGGGYDPTRPMNDWYRSWDALRKSAGLPDIRYYDLRHTAITDLLGNASIPERVVIEIAGHVSNKMLNRYSHQRKAEKQSALNALDKLSEKIAEPKPQAANSTLSLTRWSISPKSDDDEKAG